MSENDKTKQSEIFYGSWGAATDRPRHFNHLQSVEAVVGAGVFRWDRGRNDSFNSCARMVDLARALCLHQPPQTPK